MLGKNKTEDAKEVQTVDVEALKKELTKAILDEANKERKELEAKIAKLEQQNKRIVDNVRDLDDAETKRQAKDHTFNESAVPYSKAKTGSKLRAELEKEFESAGVGRKQMKFIRKKYSGELLIKSTDIIRKGGEVLRLAYATNHESPFIEDHPTDANWMLETDIIRMLSNGSHAELTVPKTNPCLQRFMIANSRNGKEWYLEDKEKIAAERNAREEAIFDAVVAIKEMLSDENEDLIRFFAVHALNTPTPLEDACNLGRQELKAELFQSVKAKPEVVGTFNATRTDCYLKFMYMKALQMGLIKAKSGYLYYAWNNVRIGVIEGDQADSFVKAVKENPSVSQILREKTGVKNE